MDRKAIFEYVRNQYATEPEYLWAKSPKYAVLRHQNNRKWYAIVMDVPGKAVGIDCGSEKVDIIDVKCEEIAVDFYSHQPGFRPGYHMNHSNWLTILLDGTVSDDTICDLIDMSFNLTNKQNRK